eukprot:4374413-Alexandrium_andersonii.AAC.1
MAVHRFPCMVVSGGKGVAELHRVRSRRDGMAVQWLQSADRLIKFTRLLGYTYGEHDSVDGPAVLGASPPRCMGNGDRARHFTCCERHGASTSSVIWCASLAA